MANNSSSVKTWCVTVVSAILVLLIEREDQSALPLAALPVVLFFVLDVYYLSLEKRFRCSYNRFVESLHSAADDSAVRIFEVKPEPQFFGAVLRSIFSISVAPFYFLIFVICFALAKI
jgi:hypothetical protein